MDPGLHVLLGAGVRNLDGAEAGSDSAFDAYAGSDEICLFVGSWYNGKDPIFEGYLGILSAGSGKP